MQVQLFRVVLDVVALELDELVKSKFGKCLSFARVFPAYPRKILFRVRLDFHVRELEPTGAG